MTRPDLFSPIHKAIRVLLFQTTLQAARTSFRDPADVALIRERITALLERLEEHASHEDAVVMPELERLAPTLFTELQNEHVRMGGLQVEIAGILERLGGAPAGECETLGRRLQHRLHRLVAAQMAHLEREEVEANRVLWANFVDADLAAFHARILARIEPQRVAEWLAVMLPALSPPECAHVLADMRSKMPTAAFTSMTAPARAALGEVAWDAALSMAQQVA